MDALNTYPTTDSAVGFASLPEEEQETIMAIPADGDEAIEAVLLTPSVVWEVTFEHSDDPSFTNVVAYPIVVQVPFEHDKQFVRVVARKRKVAKP